LKYGGSIHCKLYTTLIDDLHNKIKANQFEFSRHAVDQSILRHVSVWEVREAIANGEVIESYPDDKYGPSCLIFGMTNEERPLHTQCSYPSRTLVKIVTFHEPDPERWIDFKRRAERPSSRKKDWSKRE